MILKMKFSLRAVRSVISVTKKKFAKVKLEQINTTCVFLGYVTFLNEIEQRAFYTRSNSATKTP